MTRPLRSTRGRRTSVAAAATAALLATLLLGGCGGDDSSSPEPSAGGDHNDADVAFATGMIPHHAQALDMVEMAEGRPVDREVRTLMDDIAKAQEPEIREMSSWLKEWGEKVPPTEGAMAGMDHGSHGSHGAHGSDDSEDDSAAMDMGMMSQADMDALEKAPDKQFQAMWLRMMITHHEGAVAMAREEKAGGESTDALDLADSIISSQQTEIREMRTLLAG